MSGKLPEVFHSYHIVNISGGIVYVEGHNGIVNLSTEIISFKVKGGIVVLEGRDLSLKELTEHTLKVYGKIKKVEVF